MDEVGSGGDERWGLDLMTSNLSLSCGYGSHSRQIAGGPTNLS